MEAIAVTAASPITDGDRVFLKYTSLSTGHDGHQPPEHVTHAASWEPTVSNLNCSPDFSIASRVAPALQAGVPARPILERERRLAPAVSARAGLERGKVTALTHQTIGHRTEVSFRSRQQAFSIHVQLSPHRGSIIRRRWSVCLAIRAGRPAIF